MLDIPGGAGIAAGSGGGGIIAGGGVAAGNGGGGMIAGGGMAAGRGGGGGIVTGASTCLLYTSPSPRDKRQSRMPSSA